MKALVAIFFIVLNVSVLGCGKGNPADALFEAPIFGQVEVPSDGGQYTIAITDPATDGSNVSYLITMSGTCGVPGKTIEISGDVSGFSVCMVGNTWTAEVDVSSAPLGTIKVKAALVGDILSSGQRQTSTPAERTLFKLTAGCNTAAQRSAIFANISSGGNGSTVPYSICTPAQLSNIRLNASYLTYKYNVFSDLDFGSTNFTRIPGNFTGEIEGNGFRVIGLSIQTILADEVGIFQFVIGATFKNLRLTNISILGRHQVGILAGRVRGPGTTTLENVSIQGSITATNNVGGVFGYGDLVPTLNSTGLNINVAITSSGSQVGGIVGRMVDAGATFSVSNSVFSGAIQGVSNVGGISGYITGVASVSQVTRSGAITVTGTYAGGLFGRIAGGTISNASVTGNLATSVEGGNGYGGGLIGYSSASTSISNCSYTGDITFGTSYVGGIIGDLHGGSVTSCNFLGNIEAIDGTGGTLLERIGGIIGNNSNAAGIAVSSCTAAGGGNASAGYTTGTIATGGRYVAGIAGVLSTNSTVAGSWSRMNVSGREQRVAGLVGSFSGSSVASSYAVGDLSLADAITGANFGGLLGAVYTTTATVTDSSYTGNMTITSVTSTPSRVGGLIGEFRGILISGSSTQATVSVAVANSVGGLVGEMVTASAQITTATSVSTVVGLANVGGLVGNWSGATGTIGSSYFNGSVTGSGNNTGGVIGYFANNGTINSSSYSVGTVTGAAYVGGLVGQTGTGFTAGSTYSTATVSGSSNYVGGLFGYIANNANLTSVYFAGASVTGGAGYVGGIIGSARQSVDLTDVFSHAPVVGNGTYVGGIEGGSDQNGRDYLRVYSFASVTNSSTLDYTGGLAGRLVGNITNSFFLGSVVSSGAYSGGLVGHHTTGNVTLSFANASVKGPNHVGGLVGYAGSGVGSINTSYFAGTVTRATGGAATTFFGPCAGGRVSDTRVAASCYFRKDTDPNVYDEASGLQYASANALGTLRTTSQMMDSASLPLLNFVLPQWELPSGGVTLNNSTYTLPVLDWMY